MKTLFPLEPIGKLPTHSTENSLREQGYIVIAGVDEAGRGCLAGPVVAGAAILHPNQVFEGLNDSKKVSPAGREKLFDLIKAEAVATSIGICTPAEVDQLNILHAAMEAMRRAVAGLKVQPDYVLVDGNRLFPNPPCPARAIIKGDLRSMSIAAGSILAKVHRDRLMQKLDLQFPGYGLAKHKGYATKAHYAALKVLGPAEIHRRSFRLV